MTNIVYDEEKKKISFSTEHFASFCLLQDIHLNMPYQMWELQPTGGATALFTVVAVCSENIFEIEVCEVLLSLYFMLTFSSAIIFVMRLDLCLPIIH